MSEIQAYALTSLERLKQRLQITDVKNDAVLERIINGATGYIERHCNRRFKKTTYTNEVHTVHARGQDSIMLRQSPIVTLTSVQYRAGTPSSPSWTSFSADEYELMGDGKSAIVRIYGGVPFGTNAVRATYDAGFLVDFTAVNDITKHTLPDELSDMCERIATKLWKRRESEGKAQEAFEGSSVTWETLLTEEDKDVLEMHTRLPEFV